MMTLPICNFVLCFFFMGCAQPAPKVKADKDIPIKAKQKTRVEGYTVVDIPAGTFMMGCTKGDTNCSPAEKPRHEVTLTRSFSIMKTEVTRAFYQQVMGTAPHSLFTCETCPVAMVSWLDTVTFANTLSELEGVIPCYTVDKQEKDEYGQPYVLWKDKACVGWRLPTEAEWEFAARGNQEFVFSGSGQLEEVAWFEENSDIQDVAVVHRAHPVASKKANGYGVYDMTGNVAEWVWDFDRRYKKSQNPKGLLGMEIGYPSAAPRTDPIGEEKSNFHIYRGGSFISHRIGSRVSIRGMMGAESSGKFIGFRLVKTKD